jgi:hypothetical protein
MLRQPSALTTIAYEPPGLNAIKSGLCPAPFGDPWSRSVVRPHAGIGISVVRRAGMPARQNKAGEEEKSSGVRAHVPRRPGPCRDGRRDSRSPPSVLRKEPGNRPWHAADPLRVSRQESVRDRSRVPIATPPEMPSAPSGPCFRVFPRPAFARSRRGISNTTSKMMMVRRIVPLGPPPDSARATADHIRALPRLCLRAGRRA